MNNEEKTATINGRKVFYWQRGDASKPAVVLLHGYPGNYENLIDLARNLGDHWRVIIPNFPSCGGSESLPGKHNLESFTVWLGDFLAHLSVKNPIIIGHSFGSRVALSFAATRSQEVKQLALITPVLRADSLLVYAVLLKYKIAKLLPARAKQAFLSSKLYEYVACKIVLKSNNRVRHKKIIERGYKELRHVHPDAQIGLFEEFYRSDLTLLAKKITLPMLVIAGEKDEVATLASIREFTSFVKSVSLKVVKGAGHLLPFEKPTATAKIITNWLNHL